MNTPAEFWIGVTLLDGSAMLFKDQQWSPLPKGSSIALHDGDKIRTGPETRVQIISSHGSIILAENGEIGFRGFDPGTAKGERRGSMTIDLIAGHIYGSFDPVNSPDRLSVVSKFVLMVCSSGTLFDLAADGHLKVYEGAAHVRISADGLLDGERHYRSIYPSEALIPGLWHVQRESGGGPRPNEINMVAQGRGTSRARPMLLEIMALASTVASPSIDSPGGPSPTRDAAGWTSFPWPPPQPSCHVDISKELREFGGIKTLGDTASLLNRALDRAGYYRQWSYLAAPNGFVLVARMEQIFADGTPKNGDERWVTEMQPLRGFDITQLMSALFNAKPGRFRVVAFVVTTERFSLNAPSPKASAVEAWLQQGYTQLPPQVSSAPFSSECVCTVLIYDFEKPLSREPVRLLTPSYLPAMRHLLATGLWNYWRREQP